MKDFPYKRALVTGGAGFIGSHIIDALLDLGVEVASVDDLTSGDKSNMSKKLLWFYQWDITSLSKMRRIFEDIQPEVVFHNAASKSLACESNPNRDLAVNAGGTLNLLRLSTEFGVKKFIHASTGSVYGELVYPVQTEEHLTNPRNFYGISKLAAENYVKLFHRKYDLNTTTLRYFHVYGPRQRDKDDAGGVVGIFCRRALQGLPLIVYGGEQVRHFTYVKDVVSANLLAAMSSFSIGKVYNCVSNACATVSALAWEVLDKFSNEAVGEIEYQEHKPGETMNWNASNKAISTIGMFEWTGFDRGLRETMEWYRKKYRRK